MILKIFAVIIDLFIGAWCISDAIVYFKRERYFRFGIMFLLTVGFICCICKYALIGG